MTAIAITTAGRVDIIVAAGVLLWLSLDLMVAGYGRGKGFPFFPLFVCAIFLGPVGWAVVLLGVTLVAGRRPPAVERSSYEDMPVLPRSNRHRPEG